MFIFWKIWRALLSRYLRFEICPFILLPTVSRFVSFVYSTIDVIFLSKKCVMSRDFKFWRMKNYKLLRICLWLAYKITKNNCVLQHFAMSFILKRGILPPLTNQVFKLEKYLLYQAKSFLVNLGRYRISVFSPLKPFVINTRY